MGEQTDPAPDLEDMQSGLARFAGTRGGEYCFMPGLRGLRWLADLEG
jgi:hypothetical protein